MPIALLGVACQAAVEAHEFADCLSSPLWLRVANGYVVQRRAAQRTVRCKRLLCVHESTDWGKYTCSDPDR